MVPVISFSNIGLVDAALELLVVLILIVVVLALLANRVRWIAHDHLEVHALLSFTLLIVDREAAWHFTRFGQFN